MGVTSQINLGPAEQDPYVSLPPHVRGEAKSGKKEGLPLRQQPLYYFLIDTWSHDHKAQVM